jgi:hypothetical protein
VLGGEVGGPASHSRVTTSVVDVVVVFALFVRSLSLTMGFALFLVRLFVLFSLSVRGVRSVELVQYIDWSSGCRSIQSTLHFTSSIDHHLPSFRELVCEASSLDTSRVCKILLALFPST